MIMMRIKTKCMIWAAALCVILAPKALAQDSVIVIEHNKLTAQLECPVYDKEEMPFVIRDFFKEKMIHQASFTKDYVLGIATTPTLLDTGRRTATAPVFIVIKQQKAGVKIELRVDKVNMYDALHHRTRDYCPASTYPSVEHYDEKTALASKDDLFTVQTELVRYLTSFCDELAAKLSEPYKMR